VTKFLDHANHCEGPWVEVADMAALTKLLGDTLARYDRKVTSDMITLAPYGIEGRFIVVLSGYGHIGFTDGPLEGA